MKKVVFRILLGICVTILCLFLISEIFLKPQVDRQLVLLPQKAQTMQATHHAASVPLSHISLFAQEAAISSQNERFYSDSGISVLGTLRAITFSLISPNRQGASTITEQLAKVVYFQGKDNLQTDILTKIYALYMTQMYPKKQILAYYLNVIYFGKNAYGISQASQTYFHTTPDKLSLAESAYLLGLIDAPSYLANHPATAQTQAALVLQTMLRGHFITTSQEDTAQKSLKTL